MWLIFLAAAAITLLLLIITIHLYIEVDDLRQDGLCSAEICSDVNTMAPFDAILQWILTLGMLLMQQKLLFLWTLPFSLINAFLYYNRPQDAGWGYHNPLNFRRKTHLMGLSRLAVVKLVYHGTSFAIFIACFVVSLAS